MSNELPTTGPATTPGAADADCCTGSTCAKPEAEPDAGWHTAARTTRILSWMSLLWMTGEGALGLVAGAASGSIALIGWALGSAIEGLASIIVIWRFTGSRTLSATAERAAQKAVAISFFLLAPSIAMQAVRDLDTRPTSTNTQLR